MRRAGWAAGPLLVWALLAIPARAQHGVFFSGGGPVNRAMGGTATAAPLDALGALFWNPATLNALETSELSAAVEMLKPRSEVPGFSYGDAGTLYLPNAALSHRFGNSPWTVGVGLLTAAGFETDYRMGPPNPVAFLPSPGTNLVLDSVSAELRVYQLTAGASVQLSDRLSLGVAGILDAATLKVDPFVFAAPVDADGDGVARYPSDADSRYHYGGGFQVGLFYIGPDGWNFGLSYKSPQRFDALRYHAADELGRRREFRFDFDLPLIASAGVSYTGLPGLLLAADVRYIDYHNAEGFETAGFTPEGAVRGIGWDSVFVVTAGAQLQVTDWLTLRGGYSYNTDPRKSQVTFVNPGSSTVVEHTASVGASLHLGGSLTASVAYVHGFENSVQGPLVLPAGAVPGTTVRGTASADALTFGVTVRY